MVGEPTTRVHADRCRRPTDTGDVGVRHLVGSTESGALSLKQTFSWCLLAVSLCVRIAFRVERLGLLLHAAERCSGHARRHQRKDSRSDDRLDRHGDVGVQSSCLLPIRNGSAPTTWVRSAPSKLCSWRLRFLLIAWDAAHRRVRWYLITWFILAVSGVLASMGGSMDLRTMPFRSGSGRSSFSLLHSRSSRGHRSGRGCANTMT